ncbi:MAG TPA: NIPSNAP family protein [Methylomirabilota bacterium]|nr:NIPSNAP family protein [Methylomirabilota bacterium]
MSTNPVAAAPDRRRFHGWMACGIAAVFFAAGALTTARWMQAKKARTESGRVFELMIYHTLPGKAPELEAIFREHARLMTKHGLDVVGFWVPNEDPAWRDTFVYLLAFPNREEAKKRWHELYIDPATRPDAEAAKLIIEKTGEEFHVDEVFMRPTDFSAMK